jgi:hypothetical protein
MSGGKARVAWFGALAVLVLVAGVHFFVGVADPVAISTSVPVTGTPKSGSVAAPHGGEVVPGWRLGGPALTQAQADAMAATLASGDTGRVGALLAGGVRARYEASPGPILAPGEILSISAADVRVTGVGRAAGLVRSHGAAGSTRWAVGLVLEDGRWRVLTMVKADTP